jgi:poly(3-hydroxybutyrate) depolymerase
MAEWVFGRTIDDISAAKVMWKFFAEHPRKPN